MIIDFHTHIFPDKIAEGVIKKLSDISGLTPAVSGTMQGLIDSMNKADVTLSVVLPVITKQEQFHSMNAFARKITPDHFTEEAGQILSFGAVHPYSPTYKEELREIKDMGLKGIKIHPDYLKIMIDDKHMINLIDAAAKEDLIITIHAGVDIGMPEKVHCPPDRSFSVLKEVRPEKCVLAHMGGFRQWDEVEALLGETPVYLDTAMSFGYMKEEQMRRLIESCGSDHILYATDSPWSDQAEGIAHVKALGLSKEDTENILYKNALKLLEIKK